jgi:hypothetical protein
MVPAPNSLLLKISGISQDLTKKKENSAKDPLMENNMKPGEDNINN